MANKIPVEVAYASSKQNKVIALEVEQGATVQDAIEQSGICEAFPDIDLSTNKVGIFGKQVSLAQILETNDRVEIYRPLLIDPKEARLLRTQRGA